MGLCTECAVRNHDFSEIKAPPMDCQFFNDSLPPRAWIDGRRCRLFYPPPLQNLECKECRRKVANAYAPGE